MEQLLIQATIMRAKRLARRLQDARASSGGEDLKFPALSLQIKNSDESLADELFRNAFTPTSNNDSKPSESSSSHSASPMFRGNMGPGFQCNERSFRLPTLQTRVKGKHRCF